MNEPVGRYYWESVVDGHFMAVPSEGTIHYEIDDFPLYLHPVEELTQNIMDIYRLSDQSIQIVFTSCRSASEFEAILRKAQEK